MSVRATFCSAATLLAGLSLILPTLVHGQGIDGKTLLNDVQSANDLRPPEGSYQQLHNYVLVELDELKLVCELSKTQVAQFEIAARGAVETALEDWVRNTEAQLKEAGQRAKRLQAKRLVPARALRAAKLMTAVPPTNAAAEHEIWTAAKKSLLSPEQAEALKKEDQARTEFQRKTTIRQVIAELDGHLHFSRQQRAQLMADLTADLFDGIVRVQPRFIELDEKSDEAIVDRLTPAQRVVWDSVRPAKRGAFFKVQVAR